jgi:hypothetical protein
MSEQGAGEVRMFQRGAWFKNDMADSDTAKMKERVSQVGEEENDTAIMLRCVQLYSLYFMRRHVS